MSYLNVDPMMTSLRTAPEEFEVNNGWLRHIPSQHNFAFDRDGRVQIHAQCNCKMLSVKTEQERELLSAFQQWHKTYWQPMMINREFASHFPQPSFVRRLLIDLTAWLHRRLSQPRRSHRHATQSVMLPAE